jgi:hypothetical protein
MKMKEVINAVHNYKEDALYKRIEKQIDDLHRMESLTKIMIALKNIEYEIVKEENIGLDLNFQIGINDSYPKGIDFNYQIDGGEENGFTISELKHDYNVTDFLDSIEDNKLNHNRGTKIKIDYGFKEHALRKIIGEKLFKQYCEELDKIELT